MFSIVDIVSQKIFRKSKILIPVHFLTLSKSFQEIKLKIKPFDIILYKFQFIYNNIILLPNPSNETSAKISEKTWIVQSTIEYPKKKEKKKKQTFELLSRQTFSYFVGQSHGSLPRPIIQKLPLEGYSNYPIGRLNAQQNLQITAKDKLSRVSSPQPRETERHSRQGHPLNYPSRWLNNQNNIAKIVNHNAYPSPGSPSVRAPRQ